MVVRPEIRRCAASQVAVRRLLMPPFGGKSFRLSGQVEKSKVPSPIAKLQANVYRPDVAQPKWRLLSDELALVPRLMGWMIEGVHERLPY